MLKGRPFTIYTNHKSVTFALGKPMDSNAAAMFIAFHSLAHAGSQATKRLIAPRVMWPELNSNVAAWCRDFQQC
jgi:hypothetical protein